MQVTLSRPDGLYLTTKATLVQLAQDEALGQFADGLVSTILTAMKLDDAEPLRLDQALHATASPAANALLTGLLALDAEISAVIDDKSRVFPLPAFLSYRGRLPLEKFALNMVRLPPLNPGGRYIFAPFDDRRYLTVRLDLHPLLNAAGHVRIAIAGPTFLPHRLKAIEERFDRQYLTPELIQTVIGDRRLSSALGEQGRRALAGILRGLVL